MPILSPAAVANAHPTVDVETTLPNFQELKATADVLAQAVGARDFQLKIADIWQQGGQKSFANLLTSVGQPTGTPFDAMVQAVNMPPEALDMVEIMYKTFGQEVATLTAEALEDMLAEGIGVATSFATSIPVIGWIAKIVIDFAVVIAKMVKKIKEQDEEVEKLYERATFDPGFDNLAMNQIVLDRMRTSKDWTGIFRPPGALHSAQTPWAGDAIVALLLEGSVEGRRIYSASIEEGAQEGWLGYVPGTTNIHRMLEVFGTSVADTGQYLPGTRDMAVQAWGLMTKNAPAIYTVDAVNAAVLWAEYLRALRDFISTTKLLSDNEKAAVIQKGQSIFGWGGPKVGKSASADPWDSYGIASSAPYTSLRQLEQLQYESLNTLTVAYVDKTFAAFSNNPKLVTRFDENRTKLLHHPARCGLDLGNVPSTSIQYRLALEQSGVGKVLCGVGEGLPLSLGPVAPVIFNPNPDPSPPPRRPPSATPTQKRSTGPLVAVGLTALGVLAYRRRRR